MAEKPISFSNLKTFLEQVKSKLETVAFTGSYTDLLNKPNIPTVPQSLKNPFALTVKQNGANAKTYDGSATQTVDITASGIGALPVAGGTIKGDLRLQSDGTTYGNRLYFGDSANVQISEQYENCLSIRGPKGIDVRSSNGELALEAETAVNITSNGGRITLSASDGIYGDQKKIVRAAVTKVVGTTKSQHTVYDCDYLCDGTADQTEIQAAINALPASGGKVVLLEGTYNTSGSININKPNVSIEGMGHDSTRISYSGTSFGCLNITGSRFEIKDLCIDYDVSGFSNIGIYINGSSAAYGLIDNVYIADFGYGINTTESNSSGKTDAYHTIRNCIASNCQVGFHLNSNRNTIQGCYAINCSETGINVEGSYNKISDNYVYKLSSYTSSQNSIKMSLSAANNFVSNNMLPGKNYTNNSETTNTFTNNKYS